MTLDDNPFRAGPTPPYSYRAGRWWIYYDPPPIPSRKWDYFAIHRDSDGEDSDGEDGSVVWAGSLKEAMEEIDLMEKEE